METLFDTKTIPKAKRFSAWHDALCGNYVTVDASLDDPDNYFGHIKYALFGEIQLSETRGPSQKVVRRRAHLGRIEKDCYYLQLMNQGAIGVRQRDAELMTNAGTMGLYYASDPYELECLGVTKARFVEIPRTALAAHMGEGDLPLTRGINAMSGMGKVLSTFLNTLADQSGAMDAFAREGIEDEILSLTALALKTAPRDLSQETTLHRTTRLEALKSYIKTHAADPMICAPRIAKAHEISERYLHDLFAASETSVTEWLWKCRLDASWKALVDAPHGTRITDIAYENGFNSSSHFSAAFRRAFGMKPSEVLGAARQLNH